MTPSQLAVAVHRDPTFLAVVRAVGYGQPARAAFDTAIEPAVKAHGRIAVDDAARRLLDTEYHRGLPYVCLKAVLLARCRMVIGPTPDEWATWYVNADGTPRPGKPKIWPPKLPGPPEPTKEELALRTEQSWELTERLSAARRTRGKEAAAEALRIEHEFMRRGWVTPPPAAEPEPPACTRAGDESARAAPPRVVKPVRTPAAKTAKRPAKKPAAKRAAKKPPKPVRKPTRKKAA